MKYLLFILSSLFMSVSIAQNNSISFQEISDVPEAYSPGTVVARMIDGLGYRYYWSSDSLTKQILNTNLLPIQEIQ